MKNMTPALALAASLFACTPASTSYQKSAVRSTAETAPIELPQNLIAREEIRIDANTTGAASFQWEQVSGPGQLIFSDANQEDTKVLADTDGTYILSLTIRDADGREVKQDMSLIWDTSRPVISALGERTASLPFKVSALVSGFDTLRWSQVSGPGSLSFSDVESSITHIQADQDGDYEVQILAKDAAGNTTVASFVLHWRSRETYKADVLPAQDLAVMAGISSWRDIDDFSVASNGHDFLVTWTQQLPDREDVDVMGMIVDGTTGQAALKNPLRISTQPRVWNPRSVFNGRDFVVTWLHSNEDDDDGYTYLEASRVSSTGTLLDDKSQTLMQTWSRFDHPSSYALVADPLSGQTLAFLNIHYDTFYVALYARALDREGVLGKQTTAMDWTHEFEGSMSVSAIWNGLDFVAFTQRSHARSLRQVNVRTHDADFSKIGDLSPLELDLFSDQAISTHDGDALFFPTLNDQVSLVRVNADTTMEKPKKIETAAPIAFKAAERNGRNFMVFGALKNASSGAPAGSLTMSLVNAEGKGVEAQSSRAQTLSSGAFGYLVAATNSHGRTLLAYVVNSNQLRTQLIKLDEQIK